MDGKKNGKPKKRGCLVDLERKGKNQSFLTSVVCLVSKLALSPYRQFHRFSSFFPLCKTHILFHKRPAMFKDKKTCGDR